VRVFKYIVWIAAVLLTACQFRNQEFVDFADIEAAKGLKFHVISQHETDLSRGLPYNCFMPDGTPVSEYVGANGSSAAKGPHKTSSVSAVEIIQELIEYDNQNKVLEIVGTYPSIDCDGNEVLLSGKVVLPKDRKPKRLILVSHYTIGSNAEAPSNCFPLEGSLVKMGYGLIVPDYLGYGVTADRLHPYLIMRETAINVTDMYFAVREWLKAVDRAPEKEDIYLMGYSQGGGTSMAVEYLVEKEYCNPADSLYIPIRRVFAGGGPYDVKGNLDECIRKDQIDYPMSVPLVLQSMVLCNHLNIGLDELIQPWLYEKIDEWVNSKRYTTGQINALIGTDVAHELVTPLVMEQDSVQLKELYDAMIANSLVSYNWTPQAPVFILHSIDDEVVPFYNATHAKEKWEGADITYDFGHYGAHGMTCIRFIDAVKTILLQEEKE